MSISTYLVFRIMSLFDTDCNKTANLFDFNGSRANHCRGFFTTDLRVVIQYSMFKEHFLLTKIYDFDRCDKFALVSQMRSKDVILDKFRFALYLHFVSLCYWNKKISLATKVFFGLFDYYFVSTYEYICFSKKFNI